MSQHINIRPGQPSDVAQILHFIRELAEYERAPEEAVASEQQLHAALFSEPQRVWSVICEIDNDAAGFALYFFNYSTWTGKHGLYLEDLYVSPDFRGRGAGKALLQHLAQVAVAEDCPRFEWNVLDWNTPAIDFYQSVGARPQSGWTGYRLSGEALQAFARGD